MATNTPPDPLAALYSSGHAYNEPRCGISFVALQLTPEQQDMLHALLMDPKRPATAIARALRQMGHRVDDAGLRRHRRGACMCSLRDDAWKRGIRGEAVEG